MACYNASPWLSEAIESALAQSWPNCEIIVVDDGSTDDSGTIARRYESRGVRVVTQANAGQGAAYNHAFRLARGSLLKCFDSDDLLSPDMVRLQIEALNRRPHAVAYSEWARFRTSPGEADFRPHPGWHDAAPVDWLIETWSDGQPMMQCGQFLIPRAILDRAGGWDERLTLINDFEFFTRLVLASDGVVFVPGARLFYRSGGTARVSARKSAAAWESAFLSATTAVEWLLAAEQSPRTRTAAAAMLQQLVYDMYPATPHLVERLETRIAQLGGSDLRPLGGKAFQIARRCLGWKVARLLQIRSGKWTAPERAPVSGRRG